MKKLLLITIVLLGMLTGCATHLYKEGLTQEQFNRDLMECKMWANAHCSMNPFMAIDLTNQCMVSKGYQLKRK